MRSAFSSAAVLGAAILIVNGCASNADDSSTASDEGAIVSHGGQRVCAGDFFDRHPVTGSSTDSTGFVMPQPFAVCDSEFAVISGTSDYAAVDARVQSSGYEPVKIAGGKAITILYAIDFKKTDVGAYTEFVVGYEVVKRGTVNPEVPWVNEYSALAPSFSPLTEVFLDRLILQRGAGTIAIRTGREFAGLDKRPGVVSIDNDAGSTHVNIRDERNEPVLTAALALDLSPAAQLAAANQLALSLGLPDASAFPPPAPELVVPLINADLRSPPATFPWTAIFNKPTMAMGTVAQSDSLQTGAGELGRLLHDMQFSPKVFVRYFDADVVYPVR